VLLPEHSATAELAESIFDQLSDACRELGIALCGGHTEVTRGLERPIVVGQMLGEVSPDRCVTAAGARVGDTLFVTKSVAIEGTALIARERPQSLGGVLSPEELDRCRRLLRSPGISVVREARLALEVGGVHALHDPTEGGLATGLRELAEASQVGLIVEQAKIPVLPECARICSQLGLDPLGLIASGSLLMAVASEQADAIEQRFRSEGLAITRIGEIVPADQGCNFRLADRRLQPIPIFARDELANFFSPQEGKSP
jgi:hydrogenase maturation factor